MAWETGTATGHIDLMNKLMTFLSTNADLVAAGQNWTVLRDTDFHWNFTWPGRLAFSTVTTSYPIVAPDPAPVVLPPANMKMRFTGQISLPSSGIYEFSIRTTGQCEIKIDGVAVAGVYAPNMVNSFISINSANLTAGLHTLEVTVVNTAINPSLGLGWKKPGDGSFSIIPSGNYVGMVASYGYTYYMNPAPADIRASIADKEYAVMGPGLSGSDEIYVHLSTVSSPQLDLYNVAVRYSTGYDAQKTAHPNGVGGLLQPGSTTETPWALLWNQSTKYWFIANGRRFIVIAKVSTTYASIHGGLILPYGLPSEFPYPVAVGASCAINARWSIQTQDHSSFWNPAGVGSASVASLYLRRTDGFPDVFKNIFSTGQAPGFTYPYRSNFNYRTSPDLNYALQPVVLYSTANGGNVYGELQGVYHISGFNNASENTLVIDTKTYLVVQSGYRTTSSDYAAILLE